jgi:hypothetical protein
MLECAKAFEAECRDLKFIFEKHWEGYISEIKQDIFLPGNVGFWFAKHLGMIKNTIRTMYMGNQDEMRYITYYDSSGCDRLNKQAYEHILQLLPLILGDNLTFTLGEMKDFECIIHIKREVF